MKAATTVGLAVLAAAVALLVGALSDDRGWLRPIAVGLLAVALAVYVIADLLRFGDCDWCGRPLERRRPCAHCRKGW